LFVCVGYSVTSKQLYAVAAEEEEEDAKYQEETILRST